MATLTLGDVVVNGNWQDVVATYAGVANVETLIQNVDDDPVFVVFGGGAAPVGKTGIALKTFDSVQGNSANVWVRGSGSISVTTI